MTSKKSFTWVLIAILIFVTDRVTKTLVLQHLAFEQPINIFPMFNLLFTFNAGSAFSFLHEAGGWQEWLFGGIAVAVSVFVVIWQLQLSAKNLWLKVALALILGGTLGNLYDRIVYHSVIDFLDFYFKQWHYPTFNVADSAICIGAIMLIVDIVCKGKIIK